LSDHEKERIQIELQMLKEFFKLSSLNEKKKSDK
jgi:hypothetical protein